MNIATPGLILVGRSSLGARYTTTLYFKHQESGDRIVHIDSAAGGEPRGPLV